MKMFVIMLRDVNNYDFELLMFDVMSRITFEVSEPSLSDVSTRLMAFITVVWSRLNTAPVSFRDRFVSLRIRYIATCLGNAVSRFLLSPFIS